MSSIWVLSLLAALVTCSSSLATRDSMPLATMGGSSMPAFALAAVGTGLLAVGFNAENGLGLAGGLTSPVLLGVAGVGVRVSAAGFDSKGLAVGVGFTSGVESLMLGPGA